jgi:hypothetical protein
MLQRIDRICRQYATRGKEREKTGLVSKIIGGPGVGGGVFVACLDRGFLSKVTISGEPFVCSVVRFFCGRVEGCRRQRALVVPGARDGDAGVVGRDVSSRKRLICGLRCDAMRCEARRVMSLLY